MQRVVHTVPDTLSTVPRACSQDRAAPPGPCQLNMQGNPPRVLDNGDEGLGMPPVLYDGAWIEMERAVQDETGVVRGLKIFQRCGSDDPLS